MTAHDTEMNPDGGSTDADNAEFCRPPSKWATAINDVGNPAPQRKVRVSVLKAQAGIPDEHVLIRDYSPNYDVPLRDDEIVDLAEGNVFYSRLICESAPGKPHSSKPKLAWFVDDRHEESLRPEQTVIMIRELFNLPKNWSLFRDHESPVDELLESDVTVKFEDGPVFVTRCKNEGTDSVTIIVEGTPHQWSKPTISHEEVVKLEVPEFPQSPPFTYAVKYSNGPSNKPSGVLSTGASVKVKEGMIFNVSETGQS